MSELRDEVYDWLAEEQRQPVAPVVRRETGSVNPVNGHGRGCVCPQCPGWYERRAAMVDASHAREITGRVVPEPRRPNVLVDQVVPVSILMAMVTVCGLVLLPVVVPLMAISAVLIVAVAIVMVAGAVAVIYAVNAIKSGHREIVRGEVVRRRRWR